MDSSSFSLFPLLAGFGATLGLVWSWWELRNSNPGHLSIRTLDHYLEVLLISGVAGLVGALLGSRMGYVFFHWSFYSIHTNEIFSIWKGGLEWGGAVLGAAIAFLLITGLYNEDPGRLANYLAPLWVILLTFLWLAAGWLSVYYGPIHSPAWWTVHVPDQSGESLSPDTHSPDRRCYYCRGRVLGWIILPESHPGKISFFYFSVHKCCCYWFYLFCETIR